MEDIRNCPRCGEPDPAIIDAAFEMGYVQIICVICGWVRTGTNRADAIARWNDRINKYKDYKRY